MATDLSFDDLIPKSPTTAPVPDRATGPSFDDLVPTPPPAPAEPPQIGGSLRRPFVPNVEAGKGQVDLFKNIVKNAPASGGQFLHDVVQPIIHPIDTATNLKNIGHGVLQKFGVLSGDEQIKYADAVGKFFVDRYGSMENIQKTIETDPVGALADLSLVLTAGGTLPVKGAATVGTVGRTIDPLNVAAKTVAAPLKAAVPVASQVIGNLGTFTGPEALRRAAVAGFEGGEKGAAFLENMRQGSTAIDDVVTEARHALGNIREQRGNAYRTEMQKLGLDKTVLDFDKIDTALANAHNIKTFHGEDLSPKTAAIRLEIGTELNNWRTLDPAVFHTAEGLDALKQKIGNIRDGTQYGTPERVYANKVYNSIRQTIVDQVPQYQKIMKGYEEASGIIKEIEKTLSLNPKASIDSALRKLQATLRKNVNTNFGKRAELAEYLVKAGAPHLMEKLAGQALNTWAPHGLGKLSAALGAGHLGLAGFTGGANLAALPLMSPRIMGETFYGAGALGRRVGNLGSHLPPGTGPAAYQAGRLNEPLANVPEPPIPFGGPGLPASPFAAGIPRRP